MTRPDPAAPGRLSRAAAKAGVGASALAVFTGGYLAMSTDDWRRIVLFSGISLAGAALASFFARRAR